jgi:hypothetical protein
MHIGDVSPDPVSWALLSGSGVPNVLFRRRKLHLGRFPGSGPLGIPGLFWAPQCVFSGGAMHIQDVSPDRVSGAVLGSPICFSGGEMHIRDVSPDPVSQALLGGSGVPNVLLRRRKLHLGRFPGSGPLGLPGLGSNTISTLNMILSQKQRFRSRVICVFIEITVFPQR